MHVGDVLALKVDEAFVRCYLRFEALGQVEQLGRLLHGACVFHATDLPGSTAR